MKKIALLFGGNSSEHDVSCLSAKSIKENIDQKKFDLTMVGISKTNEWYNFQDDLSFLEEGSWLKAQQLFRILDIVTFLKQFDIVFPIIHGTSGEDGKLQGFLDFFQLDYVGCRTLSSAIGMDKAMTKLVGEHNLIPQAPYLITNQQEYSIKKIENTFLYPLMVKPCNGGSSLGITKVHNRKELKKAIKTASFYDQKLLVEQFIHGRELECAVLANKGVHCSTIGEIIAANEFYDYEAKYHNAQSQTIIPADLDPVITSKIKEYAKTIFTAIGGRGYARVDFFYDEENEQIYFNEINTIPGFTTISMFPKLWMAEGLSYQNILTKLIQSAED